MRSVIDRFLLTAGASGRIGNSSPTQRIWKQTADGKWIKASDTADLTQTTGLQDVCANPLYSPSDIETPSTFLCGICDTPMYFQRKVTRCSICSQVFGAIKLTCERCDLQICCCEIYYYIAEEDAVFKSSCYNSYFDSAELIREQVYNQQVSVSDFNLRNQYRWLRCMWHDIIQNMDAFRAELKHASQVDTISASNTNLVIQNLGLELTKGLVRLFIIFQSKFDAESVEWFSSLIQNELTSLECVVLETCVSLSGRLEQMKELMCRLGLFASNDHLVAALVFVAEMGRLEILEYLLEDCKVDPSAEDNVAIRCASRNGHLNVVERLLQDGRVDPSTDDNSAIRHASGNGHLTIVERLLQDDRVDPSATNNYAVRYASRNGHLNVVERLLQDDRVNPSAENNFAIQQSGQNGHLNVVERLLQDDRVDPSVNDNSVIRFACVFGHENVVKRLLQDDRVDPSADENFVIRDASGAGRWKLVERLLQDPRVDPSARKWEALRIARDYQTRMCLYNHTRNAVCFLVIQDTQLMEQLTNLHNESLVIGGLCLSNTSSVASMLLPQDVIITILLKWASLVGA